MTLPEWAAALPLDRLNALLEEQRAAEARLRELRALIQEELGSLADTVQDSDERRQLVSFLYWHVLELEPRVLAMAFVGNKSDQRLRALAGPAQIDSNCLRCGRPVSFTSRTQLSTYRANSGRQLGWLCHQCDVRRKANDAALREAMWLIRDAEERSYQRELSQMHYSDYLNTSHWQTLRRNGLLHVSACERCGSKRVDMYHPVGFRQGYEDERDLIALCSGCAEAQVRAGRILPQIVTLNEAIEHLSESFPPGAMRWIVSAAQDSIVPLFEQTIGHILRELQAASDHTGVFLNTPPSIRADLQRTLVSLYPV